MQKTMMRARIMLLLRHNSNFGIKAPKIRTAHNMKRTPLDIQRFGNVTFPQIETTLWGLLLSLPVLSNVFSDHA